jgi:ERCC4-type nuclease
MDVLELPTLDVSIKIDHREGKLKELINDVNIEFVNLPLGDIEISISTESEEGEACMYRKLFERKTIPDLVASIVDGRYKSQKERMMQTDNFTSVYYIIEGDTNFMTMEPMVKGMIINTVIRDHIGIFHTKSPKETLHLVYDIYTRMKKDPAKYCGDSSLTGARNSPLVQKCSQTAAKTVLKGKQAPDETDVFTAMLCQIPTVSLKTARSIIGKYKSFTEMYKALNGLEYEKKLNILKDLTTTDSNGKNRKVSGTTVQNIVKYLFKDV